MPVAADDPASDSFNIPFNCVNRPLNLCGYAEGERYGNQEADNERQL